MFGVWAAMKDVWDAVPLYQFKKQETAGMSRLQKADEQNEHYNINSLHC